MKLPSFTADASFTPTVRGYFERARQERHDVKSVIPQFFMCGNQYQFYCCTGDYDCNAMFSSGCAGPGVCYRYGNGIYQCYAYREC